MSRQLAALLAISISSLLPFCDARLLAQRAGEDGKPASTLRPPASGAPAKSGEAEPAGTSPDAEKSEGGFLKGARSFIKSSYGWVLGLLGVAVAGVVGWMFLSGRTSRESGEFLEPLDREERSVRRSGRKSAARFSSTRIRASDVNARIGGTVEGTEIETDREYALVVEEEALKRPAPDEVDQRTGKTFVPDEDIRGLLDKRQYDAAYTEYRRRIEDDGESEFHDDLEYALSEHYLRRRDFRKAARVLEHHVATHAREDVHPRVYFNLGYIHVLTRTYNKSRRFFKLFIHSETDAEQVTRARNVLRNLRQKLRS
ncbi:MAG: hypothetical protein O7J95_00030 [Planctomycetota bacterium]|nr:hypothetical protein [Planctomycetota bacterium]